jgi:hypothetical protein
VFVVAVLQPSILESVIDSLLRVVQRGCRKDQARFSVCLRQLQLLPCVTAFVPGYTLNNDVPAVPLCSRYSMQRRTGVNGPLARAAAVRSHLGTTLTGSRRDGGMTRRLWDVLTLLGGRITVLGGIPLTRRKRGQALSLAEILEEIDIVRHGLEGAELACLEAPLLVKKSKILVTCHESRLVVFPSPHIQALAVTMAAHGRTPVHPDVVAVPLCSRLREPQRITLIVRALKVFVVAVLQLSILESVIDSFLRIVQRGCRKDQARFPVCLRQLQLLPCVTAFVPGYTLNNDVPAVPLCARYSMQRRTGVNRLLARAAAVRSLLGTALTGSRRGGAVKPHFPQPLANLLTQAPKLLESRFLRRAIIHTFLRRMPSHVVLRTFEWSRT